MTDIRKSWEIDFEPTRDFRGQWLAWRLMILFAVFSQLAMWAVLMLILELKWLT